jgi:putative transcriptional regulator
MHTLHQGQVMKLINHLKEIRQANNFTQEDLADKVGVTRQTILAIEKEKFVPSVKLAMELAAALRVPFEQLFRLE